MLACCQRKCKCLLAITARCRKEHPSTCDMGNLYRFVKPVLLFLLRREGHSYGYELACELPRVRLD